MDLVLETRLDEMSPGGHRMTLPETKNALTVSSQAKWDLLASD